ncbi:MAG: hypothetical protein KKG33_01085 [candidate division Zixibacteria bacterium]|nr:hypothetical protein [candidate division Zixibacteria bacterium]MBU1470645.1 hypothetical protein [candidate division Zixibacteria bacterium]MBU2624134.1 hypothetical protein [candidate division Zixibacteria bacterium]
MSTYVSMLFIVIGVSLIAVVGLLGLILLEVKRIRDEGRGRTAKRLNSIAN